MLQLEEAVARILANVKPIGAEDASLADALGRFAAEEIRARESLPLFDNSAMDGYAVRAEDVAKASRETPVALNVIARVAAGERAAMSVQPGSCVRVFTGSPLPQGADAVVMQEDTTLDQGSTESRPTNVLILDTVRPWQNVRFQGEDVKKGDVVVRAGERITSSKIGLLAALGFDQLSAAKRPIVGLATTGTELIEPGQPLSPGKIYESNRVTLAGLLREIGAIVKILPIWPDRLEIIRKGLAEAFSECDLIVTSGGVSVGEHDLVKPAFEGIGGRMDFWKVAIKPGKPFVFGRVGEKFLFGLPGNPVSAFVTFLLLVRPAVLKLQGALSTTLQSHPGTLAEDFKNTGDRRHFVRVRVDDGGKVHGSGLQASHALSSLGRANALLDMPAGAEWQAGKAVTVLRWE